MNSIFSSLETVCFEFLQQKIGSLSSIMKNNTGGDDKVNSTPEAQQVQKQKQEEESSRTSTRRFAIELDGLNCFETIVSN
ncbi:hypothetical protein MKW98_031708 [Papaver atlanticum]|uniref:Uncharacterized protein n=1 Tax=Papaver atlanticum TaxID=357466 RepID=A0AAD4S697_9MAGN|nr:hypothetical protein MKW98_031708 [Papaver atlanticum]